MPGKLLSAAFPIHQVGVFRHSRSKDNVGKERKRKTLLRIACLHVDPSKNGDCVIRQQSAQHIANGVSDEQRQDFDASGDRHDVSPPQLACRSRFRRGYGQPRSRTANDQRPPAADLWRGLIAGHVEIVVELKADGEKLTGSFEDPAQDVKGYELEKIENAGQHVRYSLNGITGNASFQGTTGKGGKTLAGTFRQGLAEIAPEVATVETVAARPADAAKPAAVADSAQKIAGYWRGKVGGQLEIFFAIQAKASPAKRGRASSKCRFRTCKAFDPRKIEFGGDSLDRLAIEMISLRYRKAVVGPGIAFGTRTCKAISRGKNDALRKIHDSVSDRDSSCFGGSVRRAR